jgi:hypothetical protein
VKPVRPRAAAPENAGSTTTPADWPGGAVDDGHEKFSPPLTQGASRFRFGPCAARCSEYVGRTGIEPVISSGQRPPASCALGKTDAGDGWGCASGSSNPACCFYVVCVPGVTGSGGRHVRYRPADRCSDRTFRHTYLPMSGRWAMRVFIHRTARSLMVGEPGCSFARVGAQRLSLILTRHSQIGDCTLAIKFRLR